MIGFGHQKATMRRPVYSDMGAKLGYVVSAPDGEWWTNMAGRKIGRITRYKRTRAKEIGTCVAGGTTVGGEDQWEY